MSYFKLDNVYILLIPDTADVFKDTLETIKAKEHLSDIQLVSVKNILILFGIK